MEGWDVRSAGLNTGAEVYISSEDVIWADYIFVMESAHKRKLSRNFKKHLKNQKIICLGIPDNYPFMDEELIEILNRKVLTYLS